MPRFSRHSFPDLSRGSSVAIPPPATPNEYGFAGTEGEIVHFRVNCQNADKNFDDEYFGHVDVLVIADLQLA
jgi:hypothetical protein